MEERFFRKLTGISIGVVEALALMGLLGWSYYIPIAPNTAMMFILLGGMLWFYPKLQRSKRGSALWFLVSMGGLLFSGQILLAFVANDSFNIEAFLISQPQSFQNVLTGRMSATTAGNFMILTTAMILMMFSNARSRNAAGMLALLGNFVGLAMIIGYLYDTPLLYGGFAIPMALSTALAFFFFSFAMMAALGPRYFPLRFLVGNSARARLLRAFLPVTMLAVLSHGALYALLPLNFKINYALFSTFSALFFQVVVALVIIHTARVIGNAMDKAEAERKAAEKGLRANQERLKIMLTDLTKKNEELQEARNQLIHSEKMAAVGQLSAGVAHEIKNPLAIILLSTEEIESRFGTLIKDEGHSYLQMIKNASSRANRVITDLLNFSRYSQVNPATLSLHELIDQSIALIKNTAKLKQIDIRKECLLKDVKIEVDKLLFEQVMVNLIVNAIDAIEHQGTILVRTFLKEKKEDHDLNQFVCIEVIDNGSGIPPEVIPRIFEPFFTTKEQGKGTGLGLSIVYMILERHGGKVEVESKLGKGTKFLITLPVKTGVPVPEIVL
jgi:signal transduction histidine kinase